MQVILLDTRSFRSAPIKLPGGGYQPVMDPDATVLGAAQWAWLETELRRPADIR